jgi:hypothetical protein
MNLLADPQIVIYPSQDQSGNINQVFGLGRHLHEYKAQVKLGRCSNFQPRAYKIDEGIPINVESLALASSFAL